MKILSRHTMILLILALIFIAPGVTALIVYQHPQWLHAKPTNKGELISPSIQLTSLIKPVDAVKSLRNTSSKWHVVLWNPEKCDKRCTQTLEQLTKVRLALGRHFYEVDEILLLGENDFTLTASKKIAQNKEDMTVVHASPEEMDVLLERSKTSQIFIANPEGFLVLAYATTTSPDDVYHDLKLLITTTQNKSN